MRNHLFFLCVMALSVLLPLSNCVMVTAHPRVYVSSSQGDDNNDGLSPDSPKRSIKAALSQGSEVLLKSGDVFYEKIEFHKGRVGRYGGNAKPILRGYKRLLNPRWVNVGKNLWKICLTDRNYTGFSTEGPSKLNNIGCLHEYDKDIIHGRRVQFKEELRSDWDFWQTDHTGKNVVTESDFDTLYLYLRGNPNLLLLEFSVGTSGVKMSNAELDGVRIEGFGFGISAGTKTVIRNCEIDAIGGMQQTAAGEFTSYGNGIEFYVSKNIEDCNVEANRITRCYDCGITIQGSKSGKATPRNIIIRNNVISECCQGWEDFLRNDDDVVYQICVFENNVLMNNGLTSGFNYPDSRFKFCHILGNNFKGDKGMIIRNNTFVGGNYYCSGAYQGKYMSNVWQGNTCVIKRGDYILSNYVGTKDVIRIPTERGEYRSLKAATDDAIRRYRELTGDKTTKFVIKNDSSINRRIKRLKKKYQRQ